jgi:hypothetical protein
VHDCVTACGVVHMWGRRQLIRFCAKNVEIDDYELSQGG